MSATRSKIPSRLPVAASASHRSLVHFSSAEFIVREISYAASEQQAAHAHDVPSITLVTAGDLEETTAEGVRDGGIGSVVVKPSGVVHANCYGRRGTRTLQVVFHGSDRRGAPILSAYRWHDGGPLMKTMFALLRTIRGPQPDTDADVTAILQKILQNGAGDVGEKCECSPPLWLIDAASHLQQKYSKPVSLRRLAQQIGVHRVYLARLFRRHFGCSMTEYLRRVRVRAACCLIQRGTDSLAAIATETGFSDQSHLTRVFRMEVGLPPAEIRHLLK